MCVLDNTAQRRGQGKKQGHLEDNRQGAGSSLILDFGLRIADFKILDPQLRYA